MKKRELFVVAISVSSGLFLSSAMAHEGRSPKANDAYWGDSSGHVWTDSNGHCVRTRRWTPELAIPACEGLAEEPAPAPVAAPAPKPKPKAMYKSVKLGAGALFDNNKAELKPEGRQQLDNLVEKLNQGLRVEHIDVVGHTDSRGSAEYNQRLSENRAEQVKAYLVRKGISADIISSAGRGETQPIADNATATGRAQNRRVEIGIRATQRVQ